MKEKIKEILTACKSRQEEARRLNARAGENLFQVFSLAELIAWVTERMVGARRMTEIVNPDVLRLPELDQSLVGKVLRDNPDTLEVLGEHRTVVYSSGSVPRIPFSDSLREGNKWLGLPDEGVNLPGGRGVEVEISFGYYSTFRSADIPQLKVQARECLNKEQWEKFSSSSEKPEVVLLPDPTDEASQVPEVLTHQYGICAVTEDPLLAFGMATVKSSRWNSTDPHFEVKWFRKVGEAESERSKATEKLTSLHKEAREKREAEEAKNRIEIREVRIDRRGTGHRPELNGRRIDDHGWFPMTPEFFWDDMRDLVGEFGRGLDAFAIYRGEDPLLVYLDRGKLEAVLPRVVELAKSVGADSTSEEKEDFWRKLEGFRTKEAGEAESIRREREEVEYAHQEAERIENGRQEADDRRKEAKADAKIGSTSLGDAFARFGL